MQNPYPGNGSPPMANPSYPPSPYPTGQIPPQPYGTQTGMPYTVPQGSVPYPPQPMQPTGFVPSPPGTTGNEPPKKRRKLSAFQIGIIIAVVLLILWYLYQNYAPQTQQYGTVRAGMLGTYYTGDALIVRSETPYDADGVTSVVYTAKEGSNVLRNMDICSVYSAGFSTRETASLQDYRDQIRDYQRDLLGQETTYDARMERVETDVILRAKEVRDILGGTRGNLINQETLLDAAITARQQYLRQKYTSDQRLSRLYDDEQAQLQRIDSWTKTFVAARDGIVSFYCDGYEYGLTSSNYMDFTPQEVRRMIQGNLPENVDLSKSKTTIYRMVNDGQWYVLMLLDNTEWNPAKDQKFQLQIERQENAQVDAYVKDVVRTGNELMVRLEVNASVFPVLYMRACRAELGDSISTMTVPSRALYRQDEMDGVVIIDGSNQLFVPIQILYRQGDDVYVSSLQQGLLFDGQTVLLF